jgi:ABC-type transport system involved in cytochrome bd biosynthesis fused ATPase/permease subunit
MVSAGGQNQFSKTEEFSIDLGNLLAWISGRLREGDSLRMLGCLLLLSGWIIVLAALVLLSSYGERVAFVAAGAAVEVLGLALLILRYREPKESNI